MEQATLKQIIARLSEIAAANGVIKTFQWDEQPEILTGELMPFMYAFEDGASQEGVVFSLKLKMLFMDLVQKDNSNKFNVSSDMLELAKDVVTELRRPNDIFILDETSLSYTAFYDSDFDNEAQGWGVDLTLKLLMGFDLCDTTQDTITNAIIDEDGNIWITENGEAIVYE